MTSCGLINKTKNCSGMNSYTFSKTENSKLADSFINIPPPASPQKKHIAMNAIIVKHSPFFIYLGRNLNLL